MEVKERGKEEGKTKGRRKSANLMSLEICPPPPNLQNKSKRSVILYKEKKHCFCERERCSGTGRIFRAKIKRTKKEILGGKENLDSYLIRRSTCLSRFSSINGSSGFPRENDEKGTDPYWGKNTKFGSERTGKRRIGKIRIGEASSRFQTEK